MIRSRLRLLVLGLPLFPACSNGGGATTTQPPGDVAAARLVVSADTVVLQPTTATPPAIPRTLPGTAGIDRYYRLTTPADRSFAFDLLTWQPGGSGDAVVSVAHLRDGDRVPTTPTSLGEAGMTPSGHGLGSADPWLATHGDGLARLTLSGRIKQDQLLAVRGDDDRLTLVEIVVGPESPINRPVSQDPTPQPSRQTLYSSDSLRFGLPSLAVSGDRTSIVCYEGDRADPFAFQRYELRLQHEHATDEVTVGAVQEAGADSGWWRDHEVFALYNVLGVVRSEAEGVRARLSFDRGATFGQEVALLPGYGQSRLVQVAMAADYSVAITAWRTADDSLEFVLIEGRPQAVDENGSPTWFHFDAPQVLWTTPYESTPLTTGIAWSEGGDLVIGYGASMFEPVTTGGWLTTTEYRCWTRRHLGTPVDVEVDREEVFAMDPSVAVVGQGDSLRILYTYEVRDGVRLARSDDAGSTWSVVANFGASGDHLPQVFARPSGSALRVDVVYLGARDNGLELHRTAWADLDGSATRSDEVLVGAVREGQSTTVTGPTGIAMFDLPWNVRTTQVGWLGYDAELDGDELV
ncbi:MAG: hypothetical protein JNL12_05320, partial [Planctomycetes bacterium]|nr:hypothetical protein [Planctomycetota bacterium]